MTLPGRFKPADAVRRLTDLARLADRRFVGEPKLDGQRAQLHVRDGRTVACYTWRGLGLPRHPGMAWLRELVWPFDSAVRDGEACAGDGHEGIQAVFTERKRSDGAMALVLFDVLQLQGKSIVRDPTVTGGSGSRICSTECSPCASGSARG